MLNELKLRINLWARSRFILTARYVLQRVRLKYVKMLVYERPLDIEISKVETKVPVEIRVVSAEDMSNARYQGIKLASRDDPLQHNKTLSRLSNGDVCFVAIVADQVAGYAWLCFQKRKYEPAIEREITFGDAESLIYDRLVFPEFRRIRIGEKLNEERMRFLKSRGFKKVYGYVEADNIPSIKSLDAVGFYPTKVITCLKVFRFKRIREYPVNRREAGNAWQVET